MYNKPTNHQLQYKHGFRQQPVHSLTSTPSYLPKLLCRDAVQHKTRPWIHWRRRRPREGGIESMALELAHCTTTPVLCVLFKGRARFLWTVVDVYHNYNTQPHHVPVLTWLLEQFGTSGFLRERLSLAGRPCQWRGFQPSSFSFEIPK
jgi:hypothetical protein